MRGPQRAQRDRDPGGEPAAADRDQHGPDVGELLGELEPDRPLAGDHVLVLEGVDEGRPGLLDARARVGERRVEAGAAEHDLAAVGERRLDLRHRRVLGHEDRRVDAELARRPGDRLAVVAGARPRPRPAARSAAESIASLFIAPRILNEPVRCRFSALSSVGRPDSRSERLGAVDGRDARVAARSARARPRCQRVWGLSSSPIWNTCSQDLVGRAQRVEPAEPHLSSSAASSGSASTRILQIAARPCGGDREHLGDAVRRAAPREAPVGRAPRRAARSISSQSSAVPSPRGASVSTTAGRLAGAERERPAQLAARAARRPGGRAC